MVFVYLNICICSLFWLASKMQNYCNLSRRMTKPTKYLCTQLWVLRVAKDPMLIHADSEVSDQTEWMPRLIWVLAGRTCHFVVLSSGGSFYFKMVILTWDIVAEFSDSPFHTVKIESREWQSLFSAWAFVHDLLHTCEQIVLLTEIKKNVLLVDA